MDDNGYNPTHIVYQEFICPDGYVQTKMPLLHIQFIDELAIKSRITAEPERYAHYTELIRNGMYANGMPIIYRTPKGKLFASDLRNSDMIIYAEKTVKVHPSVPRNTIHPMMSVKIIEVTSRDDIAVQRAAYLDKSQ